VSYVFSLNKCKNLTYQFVLSISVLYSQYGSSWWNWCLGAICYSICAWKHGKNIVQ